MKRTLGILILTMAWLGPAPGQTPVMHYSYDAAGRLTLVDYGTGVSIAYTYDAAGNLLTRVVTAAVQASNGEKGAGGATRTANAGQTTPKPTRSLTGGRLTVPALTKADWQPGWTAKATPASE